MKEMSVINVNSLRVLYALQTSSQVEEVIFFKGQVGIYVESDLVVLFESFVQFCFRDVRLAR